MTEAQIADRKPIPRIGDTLRCISGTRPISVSVVGAAVGSITLRCNGDWSFQGEREFSLSAERFQASAWSAA